MALKKKEVKVTQIASSNNQRVYSEIGNWQRRRTENDDLNGYLSHMQSANYYAQEAKKIINKRYGVSGVYQKDQDIARVSLRVSHLGNYAGTWGMHSQLEKVDESFYNGIKKTAEALSLVDINKIKVSNKRLNVTATTQSYDDATHTYVDMTYTKDKVNILVFVKLKVVHFSKNNQLKKGPLF